MLAVSNHQSKKQTGSCFCLSLLLLLYKSIHRNSALLTGVVVILLISSSSSSESLFASWQFAPAADTGSWERKAWSTLKYTRSPSSERDPRAHTLIQKIISEITLHYEKYFTRNTWPKQVTPNLTKLVHFYNEKGKNK